MPIRRSWPGASSAYIPFTTTIGRLLTLNRRLDQQMREATEPDTDDAS